MARWVNIAVPIAISLTFAAFVVAIKNSHDEPFLVNSSEERSKTAAEDDVDLEGNGNLLWEDNIYDDNDVFGSAESSAETPAPLQLKTARSHIDRNKKEYVGVVD